jgi:hypothetical protein
MEPVGVPPWVPATAYDPPVLIEVFDDATGEVV